MAMNPDRHLSAHWEMFKHLVEGDGDSADKHRGFYDEYLAVMDLSAEYYLQTLETVFIDHLLPRGRMQHRGTPVDLKAIRRCALMTIEGEKDDITGRGQTAAALDLTPHLSAGKKEHHLQAGVGHYGVFNGSRYRLEIAPRIKAFMEKHAADRPRNARRSPASISPEPSEVRSTVASLSPRSSSADRKNKSLRASRIGANILQGHDPDQ